MHGIRPASPPRREDRAMSERTPRKSAEVTRIDLAAAEWLVKRDRGLTPAEQDEFLQWRAADPRHAEWLARHENSWKEFDQLAQGRPEHSTEPNPDLLARPRARRRWILPASLAMAAGVVVAFTLWAPRPGEPSARATTGGAPPVAQAYERRSLEDGSTV